VTFSRELSALVWLTFSRTGPILLEVTFSRELSALVDHGRAFHARACLTAIGSGRVSQATIHARRVASAALATERAGYVVLIAATRRFGRADAHGSLSEAMYDAELARVRGFRSVIVAHKRPLAYAVH
jgi:hypothetical protein